MSEIKLKPCPHCGGTAEIVLGEDDDGKFAAVACPKCGAGSRQHYFCGDDAREYAAGAWNTRAPLEVDEGMIRRACVAWFEGDESLERHMRPGPTPARMKVALLAAFGGKADAE